jgi:hypothetical protein
MGAIGAQGDSFSAASKAACVMAPSGAAEAAPFQRTIYETGSSHLTCLCPILPLNVYINCDRK